MSSCESVSPTTFGGRCRTFRRGHLYPTQKLQPTPVTGRPSQQLAGNRPKNRVTWVVLALFPSGRGHHVSSSHVGGMSGHSLNSPVVLGCACWWLSLSLAGSWCFWLACPWCWLVGLCFVCFPFRGRRPMDRHFTRYSPLSSRTSVPCTRSPESAGQFFVNFVMGLMGWRIAGFPGADNTGGRDHLPPQPTIAFQSRPHVPYIVMDLSSCAS